MSAVEERIALAKRIYATYGSKLLEDEVVRNLLRKLDSAIDATRKFMVEIGLVELCRECAMEGKCCCRKWVENEYGIDTLLVNLLLGVELPSERVIPNACFFVGPNGCRLRVREVICVDFLCGKVTETLGHETVVKLQEIEGEELETGFLLKERIKELLSKFENESEAQVREVVQLHS
ncbi:hypothetical protein [Archaeoglobus veneficus]|uniref:Uncharacterized protein n=1 Tax=Archaeoglobus veneficus (strain DSM 11195 / SNP6) TaxID=693661 RepID=F2KMY3_ARCVS|nr:hypothetical protein [Archaeoglobus veneficus]AEA47259.1 hypothetical protein Arcve_1252 [Archaeoglobus veneficus SNP6]